MARAGITVCIAAPWYQSEDRKNVEDSVEGTGESWESLCETMRGEFFLSGLDQCATVKKKFPPKNQQFKHN